MTRAIQRLKALIHERFLPEFCNDPSRQFDVSGFNPKSIAVHETDAADFLRAWDCGLLEHRGRGQYRAARSSASEQWFWSGSKTAAVRPITLWLEPIITVAVLARLHLDFGWPKEQIGTQSKDWAFDVVAHLPGQSSEHIACEVKKTPKEVANLVNVMRRYCENRPAALDDLRGYQLNAYRKLNALDQRQAPLFWAVGPAGISQPFRARYAGNHLAGLEAISENALCYPG